MAMDLIAGRADQGGGAPPYGDAGGGGGGPGPSPDLAAALGAGGPPPDQGGAPAGPMDQTGGPPDQAGGGGTDPVDIVTQMLDLGKSYLDAEQDHEDLLAMQKVMTELQTLLTKDQQDTDKAMAGDLGPRVLRKTFGTPGA